MVGTVFWVALSNLYPNARVLIEVFVGTQKPPGCAFKTARDWIWV
jgi:hypothetical protein